MIHTCLINEVVIESYTKSKKLDFRTIRRNIEFQVSQYTDTKSVTISLRNLNHHHMYISKSVNIINNDDDQNFEIYIPEHNTVLKITQLDVTNKAAVHKCLAIEKHQIAESSNENINPNIKFPSKFVPVSFIKKSVDIYQMKKISSPLFTFKPQQYLSPQKAQNSVPILSPNNKPRGQSGYTPEIKKVKSTSSPIAKQLPIMYSPSSNEISSIKPQTLTNEQQNVLKACCEDKSNVFFSGSAGTGKSSLLSMIINELTSIHGKQTVFITATTGSAACKIGGTTVHQFAGLTVFNEDDPKDRERVLKQVLV